MLSPLKALWIIALLAAFPLFAQEPAEGTDESGDEAAVEQPADTQEEAATAEKKDEEKKAEETAEKKEESAPVTAEPVPTVAPAEQPVATPEQPVAMPEQPTAQPAEAPKTEEVVAEVKEEGEKKDEEKKDEKEAKKYNISLTNSLSQNINIDRPNFGYGLTLAGSYTMPWELNLAASIGIAYNLGYDRDRVTGDLSDSGIKKEKFNGYAFDGTPLNVELSRRFVIPVAEIGITPVIGWALPFTSQMLWGVYTLRSTLSPAVTFDRSFKLMEGMTLALAYTCAYAYNFAEYDVVIDKYTKEVLDINTQMSFTNMLTLSWSYVGVSIRIGAGYESALLYGELDQEATFAKHQLWNHSVIFQGAIGYSMKGFTDADQFVFGLGFTTAGPEYEDGNFANPKLPKGESFLNYKTSAGFTMPFSAKYTKIAATIGYNYSF